MEASKSDDFYDTTTNWRLAGGDLADSISFENGNITAAADRGIKPPMLLLPPLSNDEPCEITITFAQQHELRQVYIRSSARVYEVYYTTKQQHDKEYLCTVRCSVAMRDEEVLHIPLTELLAASRSQLELMKDRIDRNVKDNGDMGSNEDDWVKVKAADASLINSDSMPQLRKQDYFEATAEINDAEPCISVTIRFLSLQDKGCVLVDEVYVFADPIDPSESEQEEAATGIGNSSTSSLIAMFMPTILQLSRGKDVTKERDRQTSGESNRMNLKTLGNSNDSGKIMNGVQHATSFSKADQNGVSSPILVDTYAKPVDASPVPGTEIKPALSCNNLETILHQLVNKINRIEDMLIRFEDQMLKPINGIDARLQQVEEKLEELSNKSFKSELCVETKVTDLDSPKNDTDKTADTDMENRPLTSSTITVTPDSSSKNDSGDSGAELSKSRLDNTSTESVDLVSENNSIPENEMVSAESGISNEEVGHSFEKESFEEKPKRSLSINDALASALAGLLSSTSITDGKCSQALIVKEPEILNEDIMEMEKNAQTGTYPDKIQAAAEALEDTFSTSENFISSQKEARITVCTQNDTQETITGVSEKLGDSVEAYDKTETDFSVWTDDLDNETATSSTKSDSYAERDNLETTIDNTVHELENPNLTSATSCKGEARLDDVLKSVLGFERTVSSSVDFETPVLDVQFNTVQQMSDDKCFLESLVRAEESECAVDCSNEGIDDNLISVEDGEVSGGATEDTLLSVEMNQYERNEIDQHLQVVSQITPPSLI